MKTIVSKFVALLFLAGWAYSAAADEPKTTPENSIAEQAAAAMAKHRSLSYALPGYPPFQTAEGIKQLELTDAQRKEIQNIGLVYNGKVLDQRQAVAAEEREMADKLQGAELEKFQQGFYTRNTKYIEQRMQWAVEARQLIEKTLTEKQLKQVRDIEFKQSVKNLIYQPQVFADLGLDETQIKKMTEIRTAHEKKQQDLTQQLMSMQGVTADNLVKVLTPEQREKLRQKIEKLNQEMLRFQQ